MTATSTRPGGMRFVLVAFSVLAVALAATYHSVWTYAYGMGDDYVYIHSNVASEFLSHQLRTGRPLAYPPLKWMASAAQFDIGKLCWFRGLCVLMFAAFGALVAGALRRRGWTPLAAISTAAIVATLPAHQVIAGWAVMFFVPFGLLLAYLGGRFAERACDSRRVWPHIWAVLLITASACTYQPAAMMIWLVLAVRLYRAPGTPESGSDSPTAPRPLADSIRFVAIVLCGAGLSYAVLRIGHELAPQQLKLRTGLVEDAGAKVLWFLERPLPKIASGPWLAPPRWWPIALGAVALLGALRGRPWGIGRVVGRVSLALALVVVAFGPNLVIIESVDPYRALGAPAAVFAFFVVRALGPGTRIGAVVALVLAIASGWCAERNVRKLIAAPQRAEFELVREIVDRPDLEAIRSFTLVLAPPGAFRLPFQAGVEFGWPTSAIEWPARGLLFSVLGNVLPKKRWAPVTVPRPGRRGWKKRRPPGTLVINMRRLRKVDVGR